MLRRVWLKTLYARSPAGATRWVTRHGRCLREVGGTARSADRLDAGLAPDPSPVFGPNEVVLHDILEPSRHGDPHILPWDCPRVVLQALIESDLRHVTLQTQTLDRSCSISSKAASRSRNQWSRRASASAFSSSSRATHLARRMHSRRSSSSGMDRYCAIAAPMMSTPLLLFVPEGCPGLRSSAWGSSPLPGCSARPARWPGARTPAPAS